MENWSFGVPGARVMTSGLSDCNTTPKSAITATRMKGEDITELRPVVVGQKLGNIMLELTPRVAETLLVLGQFVAGNPTTRRGDIDKINSALYLIGVSLPKDYPCGVKSWFQFTS